MRTIGRYEIERELGRGAMGVVYLARDPQLHRQVAVKTYSLPEGITDESAREFHERFLREARAAASLSHPGIVTVYDAGEDPATKRPYIAMEYVPGQSLKQRLEKGDRLDPSWVVGFGAVLADALHVAHRAGIIHRDIKPANILIREGDGAAKIADFGVARLMASELTQSGAALGSPGYMSPEQIRSGALDGRSDLFSLAVVLYEAICGKRPFHGEDLVSLLYSIAHDTQVPLSRRLRGCPAGLDRFFDKALSKDPGRRFPDGAAFRKALLEAGKERPSGAADQRVEDAATVEMGPPGKKAILAGRGSGRAPAAAGQGRPGRKRFVAVALAAAVLLAIGVAAAAYIRFGSVTPWKPDARARARPSDPAATGAGGPVSPRDPIAPLPTAAAAAGASPRDGAAPQVSAAPPQATAPRPEAKASQADVEPVTAAPRVPRFVKVTVPAGTEVRLTLDAPLASSTSRAGDTFTARVVEPVIAGERVALPVGSSVQGRVSDATPAKKGLSDKGGSLSLSFDRVITPAGHGATMSAAMTSVASGSGKKTAKIIGGGAAGGALLGKILGKDSKDAAVGTALGGAIATGIAAGTRGEDVEFPAGAPLTIRLDQPLTISVGP
jgi:serine/threonine-protein kinase